MASGPESLKFNPILSDTTANRFLAPVKIVPFIWKTDNKRSWLLTQLRIFSIDFF